jgi:hypothetical protein
MARDRSDFVLGRSFGSIGRWRRNLHSGSMEGARESATMAAANPQGEWRRSMADDVVANQKTILANQKSIFVNQKAILTNQADIKKNQKALEGILRNQKAILKNQKAILGAVKK